jgi:hypothetical protein
VGETRLPHGTGGRTSAGFHFHRAGKFFSVRPNGVRHYIICVAHTTLGGKNDSIRIDAFRGWKFER